MISITIQGPPITKKNSQQILINRRTGRPFVSPSPQYKKYKAHCKDYIDYDGEPIDEPVTVKCIYYMPTRRRVDLTNLMEATHDILVDYGVLADDNNLIIKSVDGSRVEYDKENPRVEIEITKM